MKAKLLRCNVCDSWNGAYRNHCQYCGATRTVHIGKHFINLDYAKLTQGKSVQIVRGIPADYALRRLTAQ